MSYRTDRQRAFGLGASGEGVHHWWQQRVSSIALIPLVVLFLWTLFPLIGGPRDEVVAAFDNPYNALVAVLCVMAVFLHLKQGLQVVIEDYVHTAGVCGAVDHFRTVLLAFWCDRGFFRWQEWPLAGESDDRGQLPWPRMNAQSTSTMSLWSGLGDPDCGPLSAWRNKVCERRA